MPGWFETRKQSELVYVDRNVREDLLDFSRLILHGKERQQGSVPTMIAYRSPIVFC